MRGLIPRFSSRAKSASRTPPICVPPHSVAFRRSPRQFNAVSRHSVSSPGSAPNTTDSALSRTDTLIVETEGGPRSELHLSTHFQPIFSLAHRRPVGYEGLIRGTDSNGKAYLATELLAKAPAGVARMQLDRQCRALHVGNLQRLGVGDGWLFLNVDPFIAVQGQQFGSFAQMLEENGLAPHRVAVELIETPFEDERRLPAAVEHYREIGCLIVIDDFGAGYSNFDRIWRLKPDVVKIDREMTRRVTVEPLARRMFTGIVAVLHEAGALVCVEGIENEAEALCATDAGGERLRRSVCAAVEGLPRRDRRIQRAAAHPAAALHRGSRGRRAGAVGRRGPLQGGAGAARARLHRALLPGCGRRFADRRVRGIRAQCRRARPAPEADAAGHGHQLAEQALLSPRDRGAGESPDHAALSVGRRPEGLRHLVLRPFPERVVSRAVRGPRLQRPRGRRLGARARASGARRR